MNPLPLPTLRFRTFLGEADYPVITAIVNACKDADGMEHSTTLEDIRATYYPSVPLRSLSRHAFRRSRWPATWVMPLSGGM